MGRSGNDSQKQAIILATYRNLNLVCENDRKLRTKAWQRLKWGTDHSLTARAKIPGERIQPCRYRRES